MSANNLLKKSKHAYFSVFRGYIYANNGFEIKNIRLYE